VPHSDFHHHCAIGFIVTKRCIVRDANADDALALKALYKHLNPKDPEIADPAFRHGFLSIIEDPTQTILIGEVHNKIVASCTLFIMPNLTRGGRPFGLVENVVTHADYRRKGYGRAVLEVATERAQRLGCYKLMLMTGSKRREVLDFYEHAGFKQNKTGFQIRFIDQ
jgi:GNAT superfamily N-acetyltransferase